MPTPPKIHIEELEKLASLQCTQPEIAAYFKVSLQAVEQALQKPAFRDAYNRGRHSGIVSLRRAQFQAALNGNPALLIWLGKQLLGQRDTLITESTISVNEQSTYRTEVESKLARLIAETGATPRDPRQVN
jgi:hypothetical protein